MVYVRRRRGVMRTARFPRHSSLVLPVSGFVPLFAVHLAAVRPPPRPHVCSVHLPMSTEVGAVGGRFPLGAKKATICLFWKKHAQTDTKQGPRLNDSAFI